MGKHMRIECRDEDINVIHRMQTGRNQKRKAIMVQFTNRGTRERWLKKEGYRAYD